MITIELPWPDKALSPNGRPHKMAKARMVKAARKTAWAVTLGALKGKKWADPSAHLRWSFHPKTANAVDKDNCIASVKSYQDGIADALGIDDKTFSAEYQILEPIKGGAVRVAIVYFPPL